MGNTRLGEGSERKGKSFTPQNDPTGGISGVYTKAPVLMRTAAQRGHSPAVLSALREAEAAFERKGIRLDPEAQAEFQKLGDPDSEMIPQLREADRAKIIRELKDSILDQGKIVQGERGFCLTVAAEQTFFDASRYLKSRCDLIFRGETQLPDGSKIAVASDWRPYSETARSEYAKQRLTDDLYACAFERLCTGGTRVEGSTGLLASEAARGVTALTGRSCTAVFGELSGVVALGLALKGQPCVVSADMGNLGFHGIGIRGVKGSKVEYMNPWGTPTGNANFDKEGGWSTRKIANKAGQTGIEEVGLSEFKKNSFFALVAADSSGIQKIELNKELLKASGQSLEQINNLVNQARNEGNTNISLQNIAGKSFLVIDASKGVVMDLSKGGGYSIPTSDLVDLESILVLKLMESPKRDQKTQIATGRVANNNKVASGEFEDDSPSER